MADRRGFTLIELLTVLVIMGVLASIGLPHYAQFKQRALNTSMVADLRHVAEAEEGFLFTFGDYAGSLGPSEVGGTGGGGSIAFVPSDGVSITINYLGTSGWNATAHHAAMSEPTSDDCGIFVGDNANSPHVEVTQAGVVACW